jgi:hypothetical protein
VNTKNANEANKWNYGIYQDRNSDYQSRLKDSYNQLNGISNTGINASNSSGDIQTLLGNSLAKLYSQMGQTKADGTAANGANDSNLFSNLISTLLGSIL